MLYMIVISVGDLLTIINIYLFKLIAQLATKIVMNVTNLNNESDNTNSSYCNASFKKYIL